MKRVRPRPDFATPVRLAELIREFEFPDVDTVQESDVADAGISDAAGAHIHLVLGATQTIAVAGEAVEWTAEDSRFIRLDFDGPTFPATQIAIPKPGYYNVALKHFEWDSWTSGGTVQVIRTRDGTDEVVEEWVGTSGLTGAGEAKAIPCLSGDLISVFIDHEDSSAQDLANAELTIYLVDHREIGATAPEPASFAALHSTPVIGNQLALPAGRVAGDLIVLAVGYSRGTGDPTWAGYSTATGPVVAGGNSLVMYYRIATGDAADIPNLGGSGHTEVSVWAYLFKGNKTTGVLEDAASNGSPSSTVHALPDLTAVSTRSILVVFFVNDSTADTGHSWSYPNVTVQDVGEGTHIDTDVITGFGLMTPAGPTGAGTLTLIGSGTDGTIGAALFGAL